RHERQREQAIGCLAKPDQGNKVSLAPRLWFATAQIARAPRGVEHRRRGAKDGLAESKSRTGAPGHAARIHPVMVEPRSRFSAREFWRPARSCADGLLRRENGFHPPPAN